MKTAASIISLIITFPIFMYIAWYILKSIEASELIMFLFYVYVPVTALVKILFEIAEWSKKWDEKEINKIKEQSKQKTI